MSFNIAEYRAVFPEGRVSGLHKFHYPFLSPDLINLDPLFFGELHSSASIYLNYYSRIKSLDIHFPHNGKEIDHSKFYIILTACAFTLILC